MKILILLLIITLILSIISLILNIFIWKNMKNVLDKYKKKIVIENKLDTLANEIILNNRELRKKNTITLV